MAKNNWWSGYDFNWNFKSSFSIDTYEEKRKRKKTIKKKLNDFMKKNGIIGKTYIGGQLKFSRGGIYNITIPNDKMVSNNIERLQEMFEIWKKISRNKFNNGQRTFISTLVERYYKNELGYFMQGNNNLTNDDKLDRIRKIKNIMDRSVINDRDIKEIIDLVPPHKLEEINENAGHGGISGKRETIFERKKGKLALSKVENKPVKETSLFKGKRINRQYIQKIDYKPLIDKKIEKHQKQKILFLVDTSGSMYHSSNYTDYTEEMLFRIYDGPIVTTYNFIADIINLDIYDVEVIGTSDREAGYITSELVEFSKKNDGDISQIYFGGGSEGFELLTDRLAGITRDEDYLVVCTDMKVPSNAEDNLRAFIGGKKHLVLTFGDDRQFEQMNVRPVKNSKDMKNIITTLGK